jgi:hypothetical protein
MKVGTAQPNCPDSGAMGFGRGRGGDSEDRALLGGCCFCTILIVSAILVGCSFR